MPKKHAWKEVDPVLKPLFRKLGRLNREIEKAKETISSATDQKRDLTSEIQQKLADLGVHKIPASKRYGVNLGQDQGDRRIRLREQRVRINGERSLSVVSFLYNGKRKQFPWRLQTFEKGGEKFFRFERGFSGHVIEVCGGDRSVLNAAASMTKRLRDKRVKEGQDYDSRVQGL